MARIAGVTLPDEKKLDIGLTEIFGVGRNNVYTILAAAEVAVDKKVKELTDAEIARITKIIADIPTEGILRKQVTDNIGRLKTINSYRGQRHAAGLPVRGQRTRTNARQKRGARKTIGAMRKEDAAKQESAKKTKKMEEKK